VWLHRHIKRIANTGASTASSWAGKKLIAPNDLFVEEIVVVVDDGRRVLVASETHLVVVELGPRRRRPAGLAAAAASRQLAHLRLAAMTFGGVSTAPAAAGATRAQPAAAQLDVDEPKHVGHHVADHRHHHQHDRDADHRVDEHDDATPRRRRRDVTVTWHNMRCRRLKPL